MKRLLLAGLCALACSTPALADWRYTRWGMSPEEVIAASAGAASAVKDEKGKRVRDYRRLAVGEVAEGDTKFMVEFYFDQKKLKLIRYVPTGGMNCTSVEEFLLRQFGPAEPEDKVHELRDKNLVLLKTRKREWALPGGDRMTFSNLRLERPDLPQLTVEPICTNVIEAA